MELTNEFRVNLGIDQAWAVLTDLERIAPCMPGAQLQEVEGDEHRGVVKVKVGPMTAQYKGRARFLELDEAGHRAVLRAEGRETRGQGTATATITATLVPDDSSTAVSVVTDLTVTGRVAQFGRGVLADVSANLLDQFVDCLERTILADEPEAPAVAPAPATDAPEPEAAPEPEGEPPAPGTEPDTGPESAPEAEAEPPASDDQAAVAPAPETGPLVPTPEPQAVDPEPAPAPTVRKIESAEPQPIDLTRTAGAPVAKRVGPVLAVVAVAWLLKKLLSRRR